MRRRTGVVLIVVVAVVAGALAAQAAGPLQQVVPGSGMGGQRGGGAGGVPPRDLPQAITRQVAIGTGAVTVAVTAAATGRPIAGARLVLTGFAGTPPTGPFGPSVAPPAVGRGALMSIQREGVTDARGRFTFVALPAGQVRVTAMATRFLASTIGPTGRTVAPPVITLTEGEQRTVAMKLQRGGVIEGTVYGLDGEPAAGVSVRSYLFSSASGVRRLLPTRSAMTDDRGLYRLYDLQPGEYLVSATASASDTAMIDRASASAAAFEAALAATSPGSRRATPYVVVAQPSQMNLGPATSFAPTFAPSSAAAADAARLRIDPGTERTGIDIRTLAIRAGSVSGIVSGAPDGVRVMVSITRVGPTLEAENNVSAVPGPDGSFTLRNIPAGKHVVMAQTMPSPAPQVFTAGGPAQMATLDAKDRMWAMADVTVDGSDGPKLVLTLQRGRSISGVAVVPESRVRAMSNQSVVLTRSQAAPVQMQAGPLPQAPIGADGRFTLEGVGPGSYVLRLNGGGLVKSSVIDGRDTLDEPFEFDGAKDVTGAVLTIADRMATLTGAMTGVAEAGTTEYNVVLASADRRYWTPGSRRVQVARVSADGRFGFGNLPAGAYVLAAVGDIEQGAQYDPAFLEALVASGIRLTIADGVSHTQDIRAAP